MVNGGDSLDAVQVIPGSMWGPAILPERHLSAGGSVTAVMERVACATQIGGCPSKVAEKRATAGPEEQPAKGPSEPHHDLYGPASSADYQTLRVDGAGTSPVPYRWGEPVWEAFFGNIAGAVVARLNPGAVLDAGCSIGFLVKALRDRGVEAEGFDPSDWAIGEIPSETRPYCHQAAVTDELARDYDLIACIGGLQNVGPADAVAAVANFCRHGQAVLFSSAPDHADVVTAVRVRPPEYWVGLFAGNGFYRDFDFDAGFISPDAALFRPVQQVDQVVVAYERQRSDSQRELWGLQAHRQHLHGELQRLMGDRDHASAELRALKSTKTFRLTAGIRSLWARIRGTNKASRPPAPSETTGPSSYEAWVREFDTLTDEDRQGLASMISRLTWRPTFSVLMPVFNPDIGHLRQAIESVLSQTYPEWALCIADDASTAADVRAVLEEYRHRDDRIRVVYRPTNGHIVEASNSALQIAQGEFVALLDHDDEIPAHALARLALELELHPTAGILYSDEDKLDESGRRYEPYFKPVWNEDMFLGQNYLSHLGVFRRELVLAAGGFRPGFEGSQDYDLSLRVREQCSADQIRHIPQVLYHWRAHRDSTASTALAKPYARAASQRALVDHLARSGLIGEVSGVLGGGIHRVHWALPTPAPKVSIVLGGTDLAAQARSVRVLQLLTDYPTYEIQRSAGRWPFFAPEDAVGAQVGTGPPPSTAGDGVSGAATEVTASPEDAEMVCALRAGVEVIETAWLREMVGQLSRPGVGLVGARLERYDGTLTMGPLVLGSDGTLIDPLDGLDRFDVGYLGRPWLVHAVGALAPGCLLIRRSVLEEVGGLDPTLDDLWRAVDLSLRVRQRGYRVLWTPSARLCVGPAWPGPPSIRHASPQLLEKYATLISEDPAYSPNLSLEPGQGFAPAWPPRQRFPWAQAEHEPG